MFKTKDSCSNRNIKYQIDEACLDIISQAENELSIWAQSSECDKCDPVEVGRVPAYGNTSLLFNTKFPWVFHFKNEHTSYNQCFEWFRFVEHGRYGWNITDDSCSNVYTIEGPLNPYLPLLAIFTVFIVLTAFWNIARCVVYSDWLTRIWPSNVPFSELESDLGSPSPTDGGTLVRSELLPLRRQRSRIRSLDTFRGICIVLMIFINYGGGHYWFLKHSPWNGLTIADLVFPWFLWIMGVSIALSLRSQLRSCLSRRRLFYRVAYRTLTLIAIGIVLNTVGCEKNSLAELRLPGVLQRIGLAYFVVATLETVLMKPQGSFQYGRWLVIQDLLDSWVQWLVVLGLTAAHTLITLLLEVPGCPTGYVGPGGSHDHGNHANCTGGAAGYVDRMVFGEEHMYKRPTCREIYDTTQPFDPEGLLGTLTSVLMVFLGVQAGRILLSYHYTLQRVGRWMAWAILTGVIAGVLCDFSKNDGIIPVNKNLWSLSYVLALASMAFILMSFLYLLVDVKLWWGGGPVNYAGMNAILLYIGHEMTRNMFPWAWQPMYKTHLEYLSMNVWGTSLWILIAYMLFRKNVFLSL